MPNLTLQKLTRKSRPFSHVLCPAALDTEALVALESLFAVDGDWQHRDGSFYACFLREVTGDVPTDLLQRLLPRMREITGLELADRVVVTAQRMEPGQQIGVHSDQPLVGYEIARLVLQLNRSWTPADGGVLQLFESREGTVQDEVLPTYNAGFLFVLHENSFHGVTEVTAPRKSVVFNFWHVGNPPELAPAVGKLFTDIHFSTLPTALDGVMLEAEDTLPEDLTYRAGLTAIALQKWGFDERMLVDGYRYSAGMVTDVGSAIRLADWMAWLYREPFDHERWRILNRDLAGSGVDERLVETWRLCGLDH